MKVRRLLGSDRPAAGPPLSGQVAAVPPQVLYPRLHLLLAASGFEAIDVEVTRVYETAQLATAAGCCGMGDLSASAGSIEGELTVEVNGLAG